MAEMLSPGVFTTEIDASNIVPTVSNSICVFSGNFEKGPVGEYTLITSVADLISYYGTSTDITYNDFYQAYNFLQYGNKLLISRAANTNGSYTPAGTNFVSAGGFDVAGYTDTTTSLVTTYFELVNSTVAIGDIGTSVITVSDASIFTVGDVVSFGLNSGLVPGTSNEYTITAVDAGLNTITLDANLVAQFANGDEISQARAQNPANPATIEVVNGAVLAPGDLISFNQSTHYAVATVVGNIITLSVNLTDIVAVGDVVYAVSFSVNPDSGEVITVVDASIFTVGDAVSFNQSNLYEIQSIDGINNKFTLDRVLEEAAADISGVYEVAIATNGLQEAVNVGGTPTPGIDMFGDMLLIENASDWDAKYTSVPFTGADAKLKFVARNVGRWSRGMEICIAKDSAFNATIPTYAYEGIPLDSLFEYAPGVGEFGIVIRYNGTIVETFTVSFDANAKDHNNKSLYVEDVINTQSAYVFVKDNVANTAAINDYCYTVGGISDLQPLVLRHAYESDIQADDLISAHEVFANKEEIDIDIVIANETDSGASTKSLCDTRQDCIGFIGANYVDVVGQKSPTAVGNLIEWRKNGALNYNNMFIVACGNYKYQYDRYNDKYRWVNIAGDIAGLRAQTSMSRASWFASAGLERGQIKNVTKLAFNPTQGQRDLMYKNGINPIVAFPGQGTVMWGQKTLLAKPSSFDRVNVRGLFNTMERALSKMAKYQVMEFNDNFTRNRIISMIKPYLGSVQAGRGIQDFLVICDESNNTADVVSRNQLIVDIYIKPTYVAEFIQLRFTNAGTNSFSEVIGG